MANVAGRNRSKLEIVKDMLIIISAGARKTHIMYLANLSYPILDTYLTYVLEKHLAQRRVGEHGEVIYEITSKGRDFLEEYAKLEQILDRDEEVIEGSEKFTHRPLVVR